MLESIAAGEHAERSLILALAEDRRRDITRKTKNGLEAARRRGRAGGRWSTTTNAPRSSPAANVENPSAPSPPVPRDEWSGPYCRTYKSTL
ncbi:hypothetical protein GCM10010517_44930 [Streptosporangium fragile]|uniref:Resolvase/invertase-type recombinase catalytic domain-containing protein n=1 Tax=Streptosporangium fragile TaxID=46186 RepID=A0ABN3W172_9ACTN